MTGKVWLVGAGPGDWGLFTLKGLEVLQNAETVVYDALIGDEVLTMIPEAAEKINVGKRASHHRMSQDQINRTLLEKAQEGRRVVRLKGGDPFVFGRGGEELELLAENNIPYEIVPGVTSAFAVPAYNGIPVTHRAFTSSVHIITGHRRSDQEKPGDDPDIDYEMLVRSRGTLIFLMGVTTLPILMKGLLDAGMDPGTPAAILERGTTARQKRVVATAATLKEEADRAQIKAPAIIVVGEVCRLADSFAWAEKRPLAGKKILLTRPKELISEMAVRLRRLGAEILEIPAIETIPIEPNPELDEYLKKNFDGKNRVTPDWIVFTSPTGVRIFMERFLEERDIRALWGTRVAAIGEGSARRLRKYGIRADFIPSVYDGATLGKELAEQIRRERDLSGCISGGDQGKAASGCISGGDQGKAASGCVSGEDQGKAASGCVSGEDQGEAASGCISGGNQGKAASGCISGEDQGDDAAMDMAVRILIPRAAAGSPELVEELRKAGSIEIVDIPTYNTVYTRPEVIDLKAQIRDGGIDYAVFTSASTVRGFSALMEDEDLSGVRAVCIGRQTRAAADAKGMDTRMAEKATLDSLVDAVLKRAADDDNAAQ